MNIGRLCALTFAVLAGSAGNAAPTLAPLFVDHAVLQRDRPIVIEGSAAPSEVLSATLGSEMRKTVADVKGRWHLTFGAQPASADPRTLTVSGANGSVVQARDVLIGDVWLCSGQSNMELQVVRALNSANEIAGADDPLLRLATVPKGSSFVPRPETSAPVAWAGASSANVGDFSAACYYLAKELRTKLKVPIGAIAASWGGTQIRAWLDPDAAARIYGPQQVRLLSLFARDPLAANATFAPSWEQWWREVSGDKPGSEPWLQPDRRTWLALPAVSYWDRWPGGQFVNHNGWMWMRRTIPLTAAQAAQGGTLSLGVIDDMDETFVNGRPVGNSFGWDAQRNYVLPASYFHAGNNEVLVAVGNSWGTGGFQGPADVLKLVLKDGSVLPLGLGWRYSNTSAVTFPPRAPWDVIAGMGLIYNGMIAPLGQYGLKGVAWYQGESDVGTPGYRSRMAAMMQGWRTQFVQSGLPFLIVGLANYGPYATHPVDSGWASLREEQRQAVLSDVRSAIVPAFDIGERSDIHPGNKAEVGRRLAAAAAVVAYGEASAEMPAVTSVTRQRGTIVVAFSGVRGSLQSWSADTAIGFELCGIDQASCRYAQAKPLGEIVVLALDGKPVTRVRYGWADSPVINLYDERALPPGSFEMPVAQ